MKKPIGMNSVNGKGGTSDVNGKGGTSGMTLIEVSIVLVVLGLLISLGTSLMISMVKRVQFANSREIVYGDVDSLTSYAATNGRLPSPSPSTEFQGSVRNPNDAWNKPLTYITDPALSGTANTICGRRSTNLTVIAYRQPTCTLDTATIINNVAFVAASGGDNLKPQTTAVAGPVGGCAAGNQCVSVYCALRPDNNGVIYDDIVKWVNMDELRTKAGCAGAPLSIVNNELPYGSLGSTINYNATIYASGGVPLSGGNYRWCVEGTIKTVTGAYLCTSIGGTPVQINPNIDTCINSPESDSHWCVGRNLFFGNSTCAAGSSSQFTGPASGSYSVNVVVRDDNNPGTDDPACNQSSNRDNCAGKTFVLTINP
ncbi:MAG: prepilin-type N-terminal cleavage/methylation domain-containing protein [Nitrospirae bacterium]|nr:prepilin-type N-terminal cleavage/methylation domain-containing protein [Nitrospirota bacterium]